MRCAHVLDAMEWLVATERRTILCLVATVTTLLTVGIVMYTMLVVAIVEAKQTTGLHHRVKRSALPEPLHLDRCDPHRKPEEGILVDEACFDACTLGIKTCETEEEEEKKTTTTTAAATRADETTTKPSVVVDKDGNLTPEIKIMFEDMEKEDDDEQEGNTGRKLKFCVCARSSGSCACRVAPLTVVGPLEAGLPLQPGHLVDITVGRKAVKIGME